MYPVTAQLQDLSGGVISSEQTLLPFWPGSRAAALASPLKISWLWPLIDQPQQKVCTATLTSNGLAGALSPGGRLSALLDAGASHPGADLTWVIDPALLSDVSHDDRPLPGGRPAELHRRRPEAGQHRPRRAGWPRSGRSRAAQPTVLTPYANVDMTALVHQGLTRDLATAYRTGEAVASSVLHGTFGHDIAWPPGGTADLSVLTYLAAAQHVGTVVLNSSEMPPVNADAVFQPDDAVASLKVAGLPMNVLLSDNTLTGVLRAGNTSSGTLPESTEFAVRQRFLAETAMIAAEAPDSERTIVVAPPDDWSPSEALASDLLGETATAPWLTPAPLTSLSSAPDTERAVPRQPPPSGKASPGELSRRLPEQGARPRRPGWPCTSPCSTSPRRPTRAPWTRPCSPRSRPPGAGAATAQGAALADSLSEYIRNAENKVRIISSGQVPMGGASGLVPVSIQNGLHQAIRVRVVATVANSPLRTSQLTIGHFQDVVIIPANCAGHGAASCQLRAAGINPDQAQPHQRGRNAAAVHRDVDHRPVHQVRPGDPVPDRRRDRRPRAHLAVPCRPAVAARRHASCQRRGGPTG